MLLPWTMLRVTGHRTSRQTCSNQRRVCMVVLECENARLQQVQRTTLNNSFRQGASKSVTHSCQLVVVHSMQWVRLNIFTHLYTNFDHITHLHFQWSFAKTSSYLGLMCDVILTSCSLVQQFSRTRRGVGEPVQLAPEQSAASSATQISSSTASVSSSTAITLFTA